MEGLDAEKCNYRWLVLFMGFMSNSLTWGVTYSVGVLHTEWVQYFEVPMREVAFAGAIPVAVACGLGPIYGVILNKQGIRWSGIVGGITMSIGMVVSYFARSVTALCFTFGVTTGFGCGLASLVSCSTINKYFLKQRTLAESVCGSGLCAGVFVMSIVQTSFISEYTWQGAMLITGGICLNNCLITMFFITPDQVSYFPAICGPTEKSQDDVVNKDMKSLFANSELKLEVKELSFWRRSVALYKNPIFLCLITSDFFSWLCLFVPYVHLAERARLTGLDENTCSWIAATIGIAGSCGRPITGWLFNYYNVHPRIAYTIIQILCGLSIMLSPFWSTKLGLYTFAATFGFLSNGYGLIKASTAVMLGRDKYIDAFSWMLMYEGLGVLLGSPIAGWLYDVTKSYDWGFRAAGIGLIFSGLILFISCTNRHDAGNQRRVRSVNPSC